MREKRPRISIYRSQVDGLKQSDSVIGTNEASEVNEVKSVAKRKLPDIEIAELRKKDYYEPNGIKDYQIETDVIQSDESIDRQTDPSDNSTFLKDTYDTIDYNYSI